MEGAETWTFADYRSGAGLMLPWTVTLKQASQTETYRVSSVRPAPKCRRTFTIP